MNPPASATDNHKIRVARLSIISNTSLVILKLIVGLLSSSVSVLSEAAHSAVDLLAAVIAYFSVRESSKPADARHPFGHGKYESVSATVEALLIIAAAVWIIHAAVKKLMHGGEADITGWVIGVMAVSVIVNLWVSHLLFKVAKETDSMALLGDAWHLRTDVYTSGGVLVGLVVLKTFNVQVIDPIAAILVALFIGRAGFDIVRFTFSQLVDASLPIEEEAVIQDLLRKHSESFIEFHDLRARKSGPDRHVDLHLVFRDGTRIEEAHRICDHLEQRIKESLPNSNIVIHMEPISAIAPPQ